MLIVPASKVSVPLTVVMRTRSRVADSDLEPPPIEFMPTTDPDIVDENDHLFVALSTEQTIMFPSNG